jgi:hypothetical protein
MPYSFALISASLASPFYLPSELYRATPRATKLPRGFFIHSAELVSPELIGCLPGKRQANRRVAAGLLEQLVAERSALAILAATPTMIWLLTLEVRDAICRKTLVGFSSVVTSARLPYCCFAVIHSFNPLAGVWLCV